MPRGDKSAYTQKQKRKAEHIEEGYEERGVPHKEAERRIVCEIPKEMTGRPTPDIEALLVGETKAEAPAPF